MSSLLTISDVSIKIGVSVDTIRRWDKKGLIKSWRDSRNRRTFLLDEVSHLHAKLSGNHSENRYGILKSPTRTKFTVIDLFAGAGGTALGLDNAGLNHVLLNEFDKNAVATLKKNRPDWKVASDDIHNIDFTEYKGKVDIVEGGFPCQAFSYAGRKLGLEDARGTLFYEFARCVKQVQPKVLMGENVRGLASHDKGRTLQVMIQSLEGLGYIVKYKIMRAQYLDVPQKRERLVIMGVRKDLGVAPIFPDEKNYTISLREAIGDRPTSPGQTYSENKRRILDLIPEGGYWKNLPKNIQKEYMMTSYYLGGGKTGMARRLSWDEPSLTLTCSPSQKQTERCHPDETRPLNIREYARIQTFPDEWKFEGSISSQYKQIGNAVPVNLGYYMGCASIEVLERSHL